MPVPRRRPIGCRRSGRSRRSDRDAPGSTPRPLSDTTISCWRSAFFDRHFDARVATRPHVVDRVADQVREHLVHPRAVAIHPGHQPGGKHELDARRLEPRLELRGELEQHLARIDQRGPLAARRCARARAGRGSAIPSFARPARCGRGSGFPSRRASPRSPGAAGGRSRAVRPAASEGRARSRQCSARALRSPWPGAAAPGVARSASRSTTARAPPASGASVTSSVRTRPERARWISSHTA